uniref:Uncharacterized protein n=1 Tax=Noctiluca scintillans TaxID=2966 RepID=A0A7S1F1F6_NOCSC|eukprot:CAMPEP_0194506834 /NCGR_PEP_ID=MMETSP0253-20130528/35320_1 /TAXON_ID=2966 /ORGANISM="Noctiluca scintillans" /LENGTH=291 /DNA_ID=CAMNT_0039349621 /DNA_START=29 /DNA_END=904 /DNA_ORIENTATION=+
MDLQTVPKDCQFFELSPRKSLESPIRDENQDENCLNISNAMWLGFCSEPERVRKPRHASTKVSPRKLLEPSKSRPPSPSQWKSIPKCRSQHSSPRKRVEERSLPKDQRFMSRYASLSVSSRQILDARPPLEPSTHGRLPKCLSLHRFPCTPDRSCDRADESRSAASPCSEVSPASLAARSSVRRCLSSAEMEQLQVETKRLELQQMLRRNRRTLRKALAPDPGFGTGRLRCSTDVTMPQEFKLSARPPSNVREATEQATERPHNPKGLDPPLTARGTWKKPCFGSNTPRFA